jgi:hypothetical protein
MASLQSLQLSTREDYLAQLTSMVNQALNEDYQMQELVTITPQTPGIVGDPTTNMTRLNQDCGDIADEIGRLEDNASVLYNLSAAVQNALRQQIREGIYASTAGTFIEAFINQSQINSTTATLDFVAGRAMNTLITETVLNPTLTVGQNSVGSTTNSISSILNAPDSNLFTWTGELLELIVTFPTPTIVNRLTVNPDDYLGYEITSFTTSPDGSLFTDVLADLGVDSIIMNAAAGKYSGSTVVDFPPRSVSSARIVFENRVTGVSIPLRSLAMTQRSYQASAKITSNCQTSPVGEALFAADQNAFSPYVSITHQISTDGVNFTTIQPGEVTLPAKWWYRALLNRLSAAFTNNSQPLIPTTADPAYSVGFTLANSTSMAVSPTTIERTLVFENITQPIPLREIPIPGTLAISQGTVYLTSSQYSIDTNNNLSFPNTLASVTVNYQTSAQGAAGLTALQQYYTPLLNQIQFRQR